MKNDLVLGINYSGFHDTSITVADTMGKILYASSLERITRVKKDGRPPKELLESINFDNISDIAISSNRYLDESKYSSFVHPSKISDVELRYSHRLEFENFIKSLPEKNLHFVDHELSHTYSAFFHSGFDEAVCLTYDGGMANNGLFGGIYECSKKHGCTLLDGFDVDSYAKITTLYSRVTGMLGFKEGQHEGKITGLAAFGRVEQRCLELLDKWFAEKHLELTNLSELIFAYSESSNPIIYHHKDKAYEFNKDFSVFSKETIAASLQFFTEQHIVSILKNANKKGLLKKNICLAGGLFANVKINQKIAEFQDYRFDNVFIAPPMGDEGTALGAVYYLLNSKYNIRNFNHDMFLGSDYKKEKILDELRKLDLKFKILENPAKDLAKILASGDEVAYFAEKSEFGPRALGHRSILSSASDASVNKKLNKKLNRTEFMPFAPMTLEECLTESYIDYENKLLAMQYMTISCKCTQKMKNENPAVVHVDDTARPQIISKKNGLLYKIMHEYYILTGLSSIVNTSFNIHEEPIVDSPEDALKGFFLSGISYLYFEDANVLIDYAENRDLALKFLEARLKEKKYADKECGLLLDHFTQRANSMFLESQKKEVMLQELSKSLQEKEAVIQELDTYIKKNIRKVK